MMLAMFCLCAYALSAAILRRFARSMIWSAKLFISCLLEEVRSSITNALVETV
jgi:hypothetical protein